MYRSDPKSTNKKADSHLILSEFTCEWTVYSETFFFSFMTYSKKKI